MRPFGNDLTNLPNNGNGGGANNPNNNPNNDNSHSNESGSGSDDSSNDNSSDNNGQHNAYYNDDPRVPPHIARIGGIVTFSPVAGRGVIRVVERCDEAKENSMLDLSKCQLVSIPDAVFHLLRNTQLRTCDLSGNVIKKISSKFAIKFNLITDLNLAHNRLAKLPDEMSQLDALERLDISHNTFITLPMICFKLPKLRHLDASNNAIIEVDTDEMICSDKLETVDLRNNPLGRTCHRKLLHIETPFRLQLSEYIADDDW